jgi:endonuclease YncB( thermonuclease family)
MTIPGFRHFLGLVLVLLSGSPAAAEGAAACGGKPVVARIVEAVDGTSVKLEDGRIVRLVNVIAPLLIDGDSDAMLRAKEAFGKIANGKVASLFLSSEGKDRYGRLSAQSVLLGDETWLEAELLARGIARAFPSANDKCMKALLQYETKARVVRAGLWESDKFGVFGAQDAEALLAAVGRFAVVEGTIRRVGESRGRIYLDFGRRFTEDFTIIVPDRLRKNLAAQGFDPKSWRGKRIRVRGILFSWGGPAIEINEARAIELLD